MNYFLGISALKCYGKMIMLLMRLITNINFNTFYTNIETIFIISVLTFVGKFNV